MESFKSASQFFDAPAWNGFVLNITGPIAGATTDDELEEIIRSSVFPSGHIVGTAAMSAKDADHGVADPDLKLKHASGLRIVDASVMVSILHKKSFSRYPSLRQPFVTAGHTQAPVYIIAERAADLIKGDWGSPALL
jgi:choline dehydrogenase